MKEYDDIYILPIQAKKKMKFAQEQTQTVYIYGTTGVGKTIFIKNYLGRKNMLIMMAQKYSLKN